MIELQLQWECVGPGRWKAGPYQAIKQDHHRWDLRRGEKTIHTAPTLDACKTVAQSDRDRQTSVKVENYPVAMVNRVEVIDHRPTALMRGRAFTAHDAQRVVLSFQDDNKTLKVVVK